MFIDVKKSFLQTSFYNRFKVVAFSSILFLVFFILFKKYLVILISLFVCIGTMLHKRYLGMSFGIDFCLIFVMLSSARYGTAVGAFIGAVSFLVGMILSMQISKSPMITIYSSIFYILLAFVYSIVSINSIYSFPLLHILLISIPFTIGAFFLGAPLPFLIRYIPTNIIANLLFIQIFSGLLKMMF